MSYHNDLRLRDLDDENVIEATCRVCGHIWRQRPIELLLRVDHRDVRLCEIEQNLACTRFGCKSVGVRIALLRTRDTSAFVGGMP